MSKTQRRRRETLYDQLLDQGFDASVAIERDDLGRFSRAVRVRCSQCEALVINGHATHEQGCHNGRRYRCGECGQAYRDRDAAAECCAPVWDEDDRDGFDAR
jgi:hypothetical protein